MDLPIIPRSHLFAPPDRSGVRISPDGEWLAWCAPVQGVSNIWLASRTAPHEGRALTRDRHRGIGGFQWAEDSRHLLFNQDRDGDEIHHLYALRIADGERRDLTPIPGARGFVVALSRHHPGTIVAAINDRDPGWPDLWRIDIATGERSLLCENDHIRSFLLDDDFVLRGASRASADGGFTVMKAGRDGEWREWLSFDPDDARSSGMIGLDAAGRSLFLLDSRGRDTAALVEIDLESETATVLAVDEKADIGGIIPDLDTYRPLAYAVTVERRRIGVLDEAIAPDLARLGTIEELGDWSITSRSRDNRWWVLAAASDRQPSSFWLYDRQPGTVTKLFDARPALRDAPLVRMQPFTIPSRDGLPLVCYLSRPAGNPEDRATPLVLLVHGGPWVRDGFGYHGEHQWLANRGYAVLSVNFRGSSGFGKAFLLAGDREWGARMDDDLEDAVDWAIGQGIADPARLAIMGTSYGGYAVLSALTRQPDRYVCGVDVVGPSDLETLLAATPPHWAAQRAMLHRAVGDPETDAGRALLRDRSPLHRAGNIVAPLLIGQGGNDPRVPRREAEQMVEAMRANETPVDYALFPDEGHGFARPANIIAFRILTERFLARHLGGRVEEPGLQEARGTSLMFEGESWVAHGVVDQLTDPVASHQETAS